MLSLPSSELGLPCSERPVLLLQGSAAPLHYQLRRPQEKLCHAIEGEILDIVADVRSGSRVFSKWVSVLLSGEKHNEIPAEFARGYFTDAVNSMIQSTREESSGMISI
jgi:dTDP-4-dehydrorhamnose 3,5-epimerase-like enzyme